MRIVFMGSPEFAIPSLVALHQSRHRVIAVVSGPDKRRGRGKALSPTPVKAKALELGLPVIEAGDLRSDVFAEKIKALDPDLLVVVAFRILPINILEIPHKGSINLHASLLPKYRGAAPIHWAVINGDKETGCSIFFLEEKVDTGKVILREKTPIGENETTGEVYGRLMQIGGRLIVKAVNQIEEGNYKTQVQEHTVATSAPKLFSEDGKLDFSKSAREVHNRIRGLSPFPSAWTTLDGLKFKINKSQLNQNITVTAGTIHEANGRIYIGCGDKALELIEVQLQGKKAMSAVDFFRGYKGEKKIDY